MTADGPDTATVVEVVRTLDAEHPPVLEVAEALADARELPIATAQTAVYGAIDAGVLEEAGEGVRGLRVAEDPREQPAAPDCGDETPTPDTSETTTRDGDVSEYRRIYLDAAERAGRETWEFVEEEALRAALVDAGFPQLLERGDLFGVGGWRVVDTSDDGEEPARRWYYPSEHEPRPDEFRRFHELLTQETPDGYEPFYFRVQKAGKAPATQYGSWKDDDARLSVAEAVDWMNEGGNVGVAGTPDDALVNVDIDDDEATTPDDVPVSLRARSRSRTGWHTWYFDPAGDIPNIPSDEYGEIRTDWQYVVAPGSFVASTREEIPDDATDPGYYTVEDDAPVAAIEYGELPEVFRDVAESTEPADEEEDDALDDSDSDPRESTGEESAVFDVEATDLVTNKNTSDRFTSIFHDSSTGSNMSVSDEGKLHCWRHGVAHGGLQALAVLSDKTKHGCKELGAAHKRSGAGRNRLKGDWRLVWAAWHEAKERGEIPPGDPIPYVALRGLAVEEGVVARDELVVREADTGDVVENPESHDGSTYESFPPGAYADALEHVRDEHGVDPGREVPEPSDTAGDPDTEGDHRDDPREIDATVDPRRAWDAAGRVTPADLPDDRLATDPDGETFVGPQGEPVDVVRAAALAEDLADADEPLEGDAWRVAYRAARVRYDAPLPRYYTTTDAVAEYEAVVDLIGEVTFWDLDRDALNTEITQEGDEVGGAAVRALNPAWRESESGSSVLVYEPGNVWDADTESTLKTVRFVALDAGIIDDPSDRLEGSDFTDAYELLRGEYGAPLPRWDYIADGSRDVTPQLPPADALLEDTAGVDVDRLAEARRGVEELLGEAVTDAETPTVVRALPATGKTTGTIKTARDTPLSYLAPRLELQKDALETADEYGVDARVLPVLSDRQPRREVLNAAVAHVREQGTDHLRDRWGVLAAAFDGVEDDEDTGDLEPGDIFVDEDDEDTVDLERATCPTASGAHGPAWALAVHAARALGYRAREIHEDARGLFGAPLPCSCEHDEDGDGCPYGEGWKHARDPENTPDLLVGSYGHAHVETVRTAYSRDRDGELQHEPRAVVLDEYPGEAFGEDYGPEALDFATWLARSLRDDIDDRVDMQTADLWGDDWVRAWLDGEAGEADDAVRGAIDTLERAAGLLDAVEAAEHLLDEADAGALEAVDARAPLEAVGERPAEAYRELAAAVEDPRPQVARLANWIADDVVDPLGEATLWGETAPDTDAVDTAALPASGDLVALVEDALDTAQAGDDGALAALTAAAEALTGGPDGCRRLAAWASDGYAHPDAHHFLKAVAAPSGEADDPATRIDLDGFAYDPAATEGTVVDHLPTGDRARVLVDRNGHGATLDAPPDRTAGNGEPAPFVGLDATARRSNWREVLHEEVELADIHDTDRERRRFLREALDLRVVRAADRPRPYSGDPTTKDTEGDVALLEAFAEEYSGVEAPRTRDDAPTTVGSPAAITTKDVRQVLEADSRLDDTVAAWDHYGNVTGDNDLAEHRLAAVLGTQHYGDDAVEKFSALAGESVDTSREDGRGAALDYGNEVANEYLAHMREDTTMQAVLRFARGHSGATVVARTSALRDDLPVDGRAQVVETWNDTATAIARRWRALGERFTAADVADAVDVSNRQVRRVLDELDEAGYVDKIETGDGIANEYDGLEQPGAGEVELPDRDEAVASGSTPGHSPYEDIHTWNVRVRGGETTAPPPREPTPTRARGAPPAPTAEVAVEPPD